MPNLFGVFSNGAVAGKFAEASGVEDRRFRPTGAVAIRGVDSGLSVAIRAKIGEHEEGIALVQQRSMHRGKRAGFTRGPVIAAKPIDDGAEFFVGVVVIPGVVPFGPKGFDLIDGEAEDKNIFRADFFTDLDVGTVEGADREGAVEGEFHIAGARGFLAGRRNLLGEIGGGDDFLRERDAVVGQKDDFDFSSDAFVSVDAGADGVDRANDIFRDVVTGRSLGREDENARDDIERGVLQ